MRRFILAIAATAALAGGAQAGCIETLRTHGLLLRAELKCGAHWYRQGMMDLAASCAGKLGKKETMQATGYGMQTFDDTIKKFGRDAACQAALNKYSNIIRK